MKPRKWEIWLVNMPYEEGIGAKVRPALVIDPQSNYVIVGKMTTHPPRAEFQYEYQMIDWSGAGLRCQTTLRLSKMPALQESAFIKRMGVIQPTDQKNVREILKIIMHNTSTEFT